MEEPNYSQNEPGAVTWYRLYCFALLIVFLVIIPLVVFERTHQMKESGLGMGFPAPITGNSNFDQQFQQMNQMFQQQRDQEIAQIWTITALFCAVFGGLIFVALRISPTPGAWTFHILILCLGLGGCFLPFSVLLLVQWFQPATLRYFGKIPES